MSGQKSGHNNTLADLLPGPKKILNTNKRVILSPRNGKRVTAKFVSVNGNSATMKIVDTGEITSFSLNTAARRA